MVLLLVLVLLEYGYLIINLGLDLKNAGDEFGDTLLFVLFVLFVLWSIELGDDCYFIYIRFVFVFVLLCVFVFDGGVFVFVFVWYVDCVLVE